MTTMSLIATLLAHQGGWDEILLVAVPVVVFAALLAVARHRAIAQAKQQQADTD